MAAMSTEFPRRFRFSPVSDGVIQMFAQPLPSVAVPVLSEKEKSDQTPPGANLLTVYVNAQTGA